jgi:hypothetical protein
MTTGEVVSAVRRAMFIGVGLAGRGEVLLKNCDEAVMLVKPPLQCGVLGGEAVMVKLQLGMSVWVDGGGRQLSAEVKLPLSSQFLDGRSQLGNLGLLLRDLLREGPILGLQAPDRSVVVMLWQLRRAGLTRGGLD